MRVRDILIGCAGGVALACLLGLAQRPDLVLLAWVVASLAYLLLRRA